MIYHQLLFKGYYYFTICVPFFIFFIGYWLKHQNDYSIRSILNFIWLSCLMALWHVFALAAAIATLCLFALLANPVRSGSGPEIKNLWDASAFFTGPHPDHLPAPSVISGPAAKRYLFFGLQRQKKPMPICMAWRKSIS